MRYRQGVVLYRYLGLLLTMKEFGNQDSGCCEGPLLIVEILPNECS